MFFNQVTLIGLVNDDIRLSYHEKKDPTLVSDRFAVCLFSIFIAGKTQHDKMTVWCKAIGQRAEQLAKYLSPKSRVLIVGKLQERSRQRDGVRRWYTSVAVDRFLMIESNREVNPGSDGEELMIPRAEYERLNRLHALWSAMPNEVREEYDLTEDTVDYDVYSHLPTHRERKLARAERLKEILRRRDAAKAQKLDEREQALLEEEE